MNPVFHSTKRIIRMIDVKPKRIVNKIIRPCSPKCLCIMYLDLSESRSQIYYDHCYRTQVKN